MTRESILAAFAPSALENLPVGVTLVDPEGIMLYFNRRAAEILDRKPEYIGRDIRACHKEKRSNDKIDRILNEFRSGGTEPHSWRLERAGRYFNVTFTPLRKDGELIGALHTVQVEQEKE